MWDFLEQNWGNIASVAGLLFSFLAFLFSKKASRAATEARELALSRSLGEDMNSANRIAADVAAYVRSEKAEMTLVRVGELISLTSYIISKVGGAVTGFVEEPADNFEGATPHRA